MQTTLQIVLIPSDLQRIAWMFKKQITKPVKPGRPRRRHRGKDQALMRFDGKDVWVDLNAAGRAKLVLPEWYSTLRMADGQLKVVKLARDKTASEMILNKMRTEQALIKAGAIPPKSEPDPEFSELLARFDKDRARSGCTDEHLRKARAHLVQALTDLSIKGLADIRNLTTQDLSRWMDQARVQRRKESLPVAPGTMRIKAACFRFFLRWLIQHKHLAVMPVFPKTSNEPIKPRRALTRAEVDKLEATAPWPRNLYYAMAFATLARSTALQSLRPEDMFLDDPAGPWMKLQRANSKTKTEQRIPIPRRLVPSLRKLIQERGPGAAIFGGFFRPTQAGYFRGDLEKAGIPYENIEGIAVIHSLRHGGATEMLLKGVDILLVQRMGGWKSVAMLAKHYAHLSPVRDRAKIDEAFK